MNLYIDFYINLYIIFCKKLKYYIIRYTLKLFKNNILTYYCIILTSINVKCFFLILENFSTFDFDFDFVDKPYLISSLIYSSRFGFINLVIFLQYCKRLCELYMAVSTAGHATMQKRIGHCFRNQNISPTGLNNSICYCYNLHKI